VLPPGAQDHREKEKMLQLSHTWYVYFWRSCINLIYEALMWCMCTSGRGTKSR